MKIFVIGHITKGFRFYGPVSDEEADDEPTGLLEHDDDWFVAEVEPVSEA